VAFAFSVKNFILLKGNILLNLISPFPNKTERRDSHQLGHLCCCKKLAYVEELPEKNSLVHPFGDALFHFNTRIFPKQTTTRSGNRRQ
jgi:hypothetical protein